MKKAVYHSIEPFGTVDGQGIRLVLFLSGCHLGCKFCHNRDTWDESGKTITVEEVLAKYDRYRSYYDASGGGITVSGGEPLLQASFVEELFQECRAKGIHTTLDTSGFVSPEALHAVLPYTDAILYGLKAANSLTHQKLTVHDNSLILSNLALVAGRTNVTVRYVILPGLNDSDDEIQLLIDRIKGLPTLVPVELLPYHTLGKSKWEQLGVDYSLADVREASAADVDRVAGKLRQQGIRVLTANM